MLIRYATTEDIKEIEKILNNHDLEARKALWYEWYLKLDDECKFWDPIFVIWDDPIGYMELSGYSQQLRFNIDRLWIHEDHRNNWYWRKMIERAIIEAKKMKFNIITLKVFDWNKEAIALYEKIWFKENWKMPEYSYGVQTGYTINMEIKL